MDMIPVYDQGAQTTRAAVHGALRAELDALGTRLAAFRDAASSEMERLAAFRWATELAGFTGNEVAERTGVSRQTLLNLRSNGRGGDWPMDLRMLLELGLSGPRSTEDLRESIVPIHDHEFDLAVERLEAEGLIQEASRAPSTTTTPIRIWRLSAQGIEELPRRLRHAAMPPSRTWTAYVVSSTDEANAIAEAGTKAFGEYSVAVIPAGTVHGMERPEIAFHVEATDPQIAESAATALFHELRARAGLSERQAPVVVSMLIPPRRRE
jgi:transcriptional regulator with XRE-family HTH domain